MKKGLYEKVINLNEKNHLEEKLNSKREVDASEFPRTMSLAYQKIIRSALQHMENNDVKKDFIKNLNQIFPDAHFETQLNLEELLAIAENQEELHNYIENRPLTSIAESSLFTGRSGPTLISELAREIRTSDEIYFLVSFIKYKGITLLMDALKEFTKTKKLYLITTSYMQASDFKAIKVLSELPNTEIKISYDTDRTRLHAKAYIFKRESGFSTAYIGSSNISNPAMTKGLEWNLKISEYTSPDVYTQIIQNFQSYWNDEEFENFDITDEHNVIELQQALKKQSFTQDKGFFYELKPYSHQKAILEDLDFERQEIGSYRNLVVSATGTGKTMLAAFDYKRQLAFGDKKLLFLAHRKEILEQSMRTFRDVLKDFNFGGLMVDGIVSIDNDHIFASVQTMVSSDNYLQFPANYFDYIVLDETHHASASTYHKLLEYFQPDILLGLTATPERMDGVDIKVYFNHRIASEIRLGDAIERKLLSPFDYFAVTDSSDIDLSHLKWNRNGYDISELENLYTKSKQRVQLIIDSLEKYVTDTTQMRTVGFCVSIAHANFMKNSFNSYGIKSEALSSETSGDDRKRIISEFRKGEYKCIFTVDLLNEGVDIPEIDTLMFLRPTQSQTIFLQQLGRGLRLSDNKESLTVLDFIGQAHENYDYTFKFRALTGRSDKPLKEQIKNEFPNLPAGCHIQMEKIAKEYILRNINNSKTDEKALRTMVENYSLHFDSELNLPNFFHNYEIKQVQFYSKPKRTFNKLLFDVGIKEEYKVADANEFAQSLRRISQINSKRLISFSLKYLASDFSTKSFSEQDFRLLNMLYFAIWNSPKNESYESSFKHLKTNNEDIFEEIITLLKMNEQNRKILELEYEEKHIPLDIYASYTTDQIFAAYGKNNNNYKFPFREGVYYFKDENTDAFFITINKSEKDYLPSTMYKDYAINNYLFNWESQSITSVESLTGQRYIKNEEGHKVLLFVRENRKNFSATAPYIFIGNAKYVKHQGSKPIEIIWKLDHPIPERIISESALRIIV